MLCPPDQILLGLLNQEECDGRHVWHVWGKRDMHTGFWWGESRERGHLEDLCVDGNVILKWIFKKLDGEAWTGLVCDLPCFDSSGRVTARAFMH